MVDLYIHVGPHKTGTTFLQNYFWYNRHKLLEHGVLYPEAGIIHNKAGPRHRNLALNADPVHWERLIKEVKETGAKKVLISCELFSLSPGVLKNSEKYLSFFNANLVVFVRDDVERIRSSFIHFKKSKNNGKKLSSDIALDFNSWWESKKYKLSYANTLNAWLEFMPKDSVHFVSYKKCKKTSIEKEFSRELNIPYFITDVPLESNPSVGAFSIEASRFFYKFGNRSSRLAFKISRKLENSFPKLKKSKIRGFDEVEIRKYMKEVNKPFFDIYPSLKESDSSGDL